jgi:hypothetical protein
VWRGPSAAGKRSSLGKAARAIGGATEPSRSRGVSLLPYSSPLPPQISPSHPNTRRPRQVGFWRLLRVSGWVEGVGREALVGGGGRAGRCVLPPRSD